MSLHPKDPVSVTANLIYSEPAPAVAFHTRHMHLTMNDRQWTDNWENSKASTALYLFGAELRGLFVRPLFPPCHMIGHWTGCVFQARLLSSKLPSSQ